MSNKLKKISLIIIIFLISIVLFGQIHTNAQSYNSKLSNNEEYSVRLTKPYEDAYPFWIKADGNSIFCNQHGAALRNSTYEFSRSWGWLSYQDAMAYIFSAYGDEYINNHDTGYGTPQGDKISSGKDYNNYSDYSLLQKVVWNINSINDMIRRQIDEYHGEDIDQSLDPDKDFPPYSETISAVGLDTKGNVLANEALQYMFLQEEIKENGGKYKCDIEKGDDFSVSVNREKGIYTIGDLRVNYFKYVTDNIELANITSIYVIDTETGDEVDDIIFQCAEENGDTAADVDYGEIYLDGKLPSSGKKFNIIVPTNSDDEVKKIQVMVDYKYLGYCEAQFTTWRLNREYDWWVNYAWQNQLTFDGGYRQWVTGTVNVNAEESATWTFELQKLGAENQKPLPNVKFEITFYDVNGMVKKDTQTYTTNSRGIIEIPGLDFYGDLKIKIKEVETNNGYKLDSTEKWIYVHKDRGPTNKFTDIKTREDDDNTAWAKINGQVPEGKNEDELKGEVNGNDGLKLTALIENVKEGFNIDIIKVDRWDYNLGNINELSGAEFTFKLVKIEDGEEVTIFKGTKLKSPIVSITEKDIQEYIQKYKLNYNYDIEGEYIAYITETKVPSGYQSNLKGDEIKVEFDVDKKWLSSKYELEVTKEVTVKDNITGKYSENAAQYVETETNSPDEEISLSIYVKNTPNIPSSGGTSGGGSSKYYTLNLEKFGVKQENINDKSKYYTLNDIPFKITLYQIQNGGTLKQLRSNNYKTSGGKITLSSLTYTGDILVKVEENSSNDYSIVGNKTNYIRYNVTKSGRYYYINDYYYADANGNKLKENSSLELTTDGITLNKSGTSYIPVLNMEILNIKDPEIDLTMDIKGTVFLDAITGKAGQVDGLYDGADNPIEGIEVTLCDTNGNPIEREGLINPVRTDVNGQYSFTDLNAMKKYIVKFIYNGQDYQAINALSDADYTTAQENGYDTVDLWEEYSKAQEDLLHNQPGDITRQDLNNRFATISAYPNSYTRADGTSNVAYSDEVMKEVYSDILEAIDQGNNTSEEISNYLVQQNKIEELESKLKFVKDCEIVAYTKEYPAMNKFNISDVDKKLYTVDWETKTTIYPAENYPALYEGQNQINFGLKERPNVDLMLSEDVHKTNVTVNEQTTTFNYNRKLANGEDSKIGLYESDIDYSQHVRSFDITRNTDPSNGEAYYDTQSDLSVEVFYKVRLYNDSETNAEVTQIVDYYDSDFYQFEAAYLGDNNGYDETKLLTTTINDKVFTKTNEDGTTTTYKAQTIEIPSEDENIMTPAGSRYVYIKLKTVDAPTSLALLASETVDEVETRNYVEISQYKTYYGTTVTSGTPGLVDIDSIAGNFDLDRYDNGNREDDENKAPELFYKLPGEENRTLSGNVFEDLRSNLSTGDVKKDPLTDTNQIKGIKGIKVELVELVGNTEKIRQTVYTDDSGNYTFTNFIPGKYFVRFTYGDKVYEVGGESKTLSSQDYQSTYANPYTNTNQNDKPVTYWYAETNDNGEVILNDNQVGSNNPNRYSDAYDEVKDREDSITYSRNMTNSNVVALKTYSTATDEAELEAIKNHMTMQAYTSLLELEVEFATKDTKGNESKTYNIENIDFGLIKRAESNLELEKRVSHIKITQADNTVLLDADVEMRESVLGTKALVLLYNGEEIQNDRVHFQYVPTPNAYGTGAVRLEIDDEILHGNNIEITYTLTVRNTTPKATTLTWFKGNGTLVAVGYYEEDTKDLVYFENGEIVFHKSVDGTVKTVATVASIQRIEPETVKTKADIIVDYVSNNMQFDDTQNFGYWHLPEEKTDIIGYFEEDVESEVAQYNNILLTSHTNPLVQDYLAPGEYRETELVLSTTNTQDVDLDYTNITEILGLSNQAGRVDAVSTPGNLNPVSAKVVDFVRDTDSANNITDGSITYVDDYDNDNPEVINRTKVNLDTNPNTGVDNEDYLTTEVTRNVFEPDSAKAETVTITAPTGDTHYYYVLIGGLLAIFALGIVGIKKFVLNKK